MVFTRRQKAEDDATQVDKVDDACSIAAPLTTSANTVCPNDMAMTSIAQSGRLAPADVSMKTVIGETVSRNNGDMLATLMIPKEAGRSRKTPSKGTSPRQKIKVESDEENATGMKEASTSNTDENGRSKRRRIKKTAVTEQVTADDSDYISNTALTLSHESHFSTRILRKRRPAPVLRTVGVLTLGISPPAFARTLRRMEKRKHTRLRRVVPSSNRFNFTFGRSVLAYHNWVRQVDINNVARILKEERPSLLAQISQNDATTPPMHAGQTFSVDAIVRVMLSQSSTNEGALDAQQCMIHAYPYMVNGVKVIGTIPNYHLMRVQSAKKLEMVLTRAGLQEKKAKYIKRCLDEIYCHNVSLISPGEVVYRFNDPNASDFVPGLLSVDYISEIYATKGKQAVFDCLVRFMMIGIKSAFCIMAFRMNIPVFAVDTHVAGMVKLLGWVPQDATEDEMCSHLDFMIEDDDKKVDLHQDFWRHRRACDRCGGRSLPGSWNYENAICPLEHLITRPVPRRSLERPSKGSPQRPRTPTVKKVDEDALRGQGMIEVTYLVDDDFDALTSAIVMRTAWIDDYSMLEADVQMMGEEVEEVEEVEMQSQATEVS